MILHMSGWRVYRLMLTAKKRMKRKKFKTKTVVLSALEVGVSAPYGNSAHRVETAPVPVETCEMVRNIRIENVYHHWDVTIGRRQGGRIGDDHMSRT